MRGKAQNHGAAPFGVAVDQEETWLCMGHSKSSEKTKRSNWLWVAVALLPLLYFVKDEAYFGWSLVPPFVVALVVAGDLLYQRFRPRRGFEMLLGKSKLRVRFKRWFFLRDEVSFLRSELERVECQSKYGTMHYTLSVITRDDRFELSSLELNAIQAEYVEHELKSYLLDREALENIDEKANGN